ncbi:MAG: hypothetical protein U0L67_02700 [Paludibacteraceae bacterium]|nr:hypothetical protein [Paludibacteraceae bacterium]
MGIKFLELNGNRGMKRIVLIIMSVLLAQNILGQEFSSFYIDFMLRPEQQESKVKFPLRVGESTIRNSRSYKPFLLTNPNDFMIVCSDSLSHSVSTEESWAALYSYHTKQLIKQQFIKSGKQWKLSQYKTEPYSTMYQKEFIDFLAQFSINNNFQINHTIFPLPVTRPNPKEKKKLLLPRDWVHLNFAKQYPQIIFLHPDREVNNRKIYIFQKGRLTQVFNFIRINKQWYLIEKYEK